MFNDSLERILRSKKTHHKNEWNVPQEYNSIKIVFEVITRNFKGIVLHSINEVQLGYPLHFL